MDNNNLQGILVNAFNRKKAGNPAYSRSALARDLGVSSAFVSNLLSSRKPIPHNMYDKLCFVLELDSVEKDSLTDALIFETKSKNKLLSKFQSSVESRPAPKTQKRQNSEMSVNLLTHWYYLAVLESLSTTANNPASDTIAKRLALSDYQFKDAINFLSTNKLITLKDGRWVKNENHLYFPVGRSKQTVRQFHKQMLEKARLDIESKAREDDFQKRLYLGFTFSADLKNIEKIKSKLQKLLSEISIEAGEGTCSDVYQCNLQLFPLTEDKK